jgi:phage shock protein E
MENLNNIIEGSSSNTLETLVKGGAFLVDVRTPEEFAEGNVKESTNIPLDQVNINLDKFKGKANIVVFCRSGNRSSQAKNILEINGFTNVINGGTWQDINEILNK